MGNTAVAVLHYDMHDDIEKAAPRMGEAMLSMPGRERPADFGFGQIISWDHSSGPQVCVVYGNTGWRVSLDNEVPQRVLDEIVDILKWRGYKITAPKEKANAV